MDRGTSFCVGEPALGTNRKKENSKVKTGSAESSLIDSFIKAFIDSFCFFQSTFMYINSCQILLKRVQISVMS